MYRLLTSNVSVWVETALSNHERYENFKSGLCLSRFDDPVESKVNPVATVDVGITSPLAFFKVELDQ